MNVLSRHMRNAVVLTALVHPASAAGESVQPVNLDNVQGRSGLSLEVHGQVHLGNAASPYSFGAMGTSNGPEKNVVTPAMTSPLQGLFVSRGGANVYWCPAFNFGCTSSPQFAAQLAGVFTTAADAHVQESGILELMFNNTGEDAPWSGSSVYSSGDYVEANSKLFVESAPKCVSGASGTGPASTATQISDNSCLWNYAGPSYVEGKNALNVNTIDSRGGGKSWNFAGGTIIAAGWNGKFATNIEMDLHNDAQDAPPGGRTSINNIYLGGAAGLFPVTSEVYISPDPNGASFGAYDGVWINGPYAVENCDICISTLHSKVGYYDNGAHTISSISDASRSPVGVDLAGSYETGIKMTAASLSSYAIQAPNFSVDRGGNISAIGIQFTGHISAAGGAVPSLGTCGGSPSLASGSSDTRGSVTIGSGGVTSCTIRFGSNYSNTPTIVVSPNSPGGGRIYVTDISPAGFTMRSSSDIDAERLSWIAIQ